MVKALVMYLLGAGTVNAATFYVSPTGTGNAQSINAPGTPWLAWSNAYGITSDDVVLVRGGLYRRTNFGSFDNITGALATNYTPVTFSGTTNHLVAWRAYPGEVPVFDNVRLRFGSERFHRFWGLWFTDSARYAFPQASNTWTISTIDDHGSITTGNEWINCVFHDTWSVFTGFSAGDLVRGCIGWNVGTDYRHHIVYPFVGRFDGNLFGNTAGSIIQHGWPGMSLNFNIGFGAGSVNSHGTWEFLVDQPSSTISNILWDFPNLDTAGFAVGNATNGGTFLMSGNFASGSKPAGLSAPFTATTFISTNNRFHMSSPGGAQVFNLTDATTNGGTLAIDRNGYSSAVTATFGPNNVNFATWKSTSGKDANSTSANSSLPADTVWVFPNADEAKRAHIAILNTSSNHNVSVDLSSILNVGDRFVLKSAQDYDGAVVLSGIYAGGSISIPMTNLSVAEILSGTNTTYLGLSVEEPLVKPPPTSPGFGAFVVQGAESTAASALRGGTLQGGALR